MITVIGVRFRTAGKIYYFDPAGRKVKTGDHVIVETARGIEYGYVVLGNREVDESKVVPPLKPVIVWPLLRMRRWRQRIRIRKKRHLRFARTKLRSITWR